MLSNHAVQYRVQEFPVLMNDEMILHSDTGWVPVCGDVVELDDFGNEIKPGVHKRVSQLIRKHKGLFSRYNR